MTRLLYVNARHSNSQNEYVILRKSASVKGLPRSNLKVIQDCSRYMIGLAWKMGKYNFL